MARRLILGGAVIVLILFGVPPLLTLVSRSLNVHGSWSIESYRAVFGSGRSWALLGNSLALASLTTLVATVGGVTLGILFGRTDIPLRRTFAALFTAPLLLPPYVLAVSWSTLLPVRGLPGCVLVLGTCFMPVVMILTASSLRAADPRLEEAGRIAAGWGRTLRSISLPIAAPGILLGAVLVFLLSLGEFGVPSFLRFDVYPVETFTQFAAFNDFGAAAASAVPIALISIVLVSAEQQFLGRRVGTLRPRSPDAAAPNIPLGRARVAAFAATGALAVLFVLIPLASLVARSLRPWGYGEAFARAGDSLVRSLVYAGLGASLIAALGFPLGYLIQRKALPMGRMVDSLTILLFALPSTVLGVALISFWNRPVLNVVYATPVIIMIGYLIQFSAIGSRILVSALSQIPASVEEAARVGGAGWARTAGLIVAPLARRGVAAAWLVGFIFCLRDLGITMVVYPPGRDTLPVRTFTLMANGSASLIAALTVLMVAATLVPMALLLAALGRRAPV
jgi:iron(III) transport system permease protein